MTELYRPEWKPGFAKRVDLAEHSTFACVEKWHEDQVKWVENKTGIINPKRDVLIANVEPYEVRVDDTPNLTTTLGLGRLTSSLTGGAPVVFSGTSTTCLGVGSGSTAAAAADTDLQTPLYYEVADSTPTITTTTVTNDTIQVVATFASANGNGAWNEWGLVLVTTAVSATTKAGTGTSPILFNHKIASLGTKASGASWAFTVKLTWS
jgi:hypothetical protein